MAKRKENSLNNLKSLNTNLQSEPQKTPKKSSKNPNKLKQDNKTLAQLLLTALSMPDEETGEPNEIAITNSIIRKAINGDISAFNTIRDTIGQKPKDVVENINPPIINISGINI